MLDRFEAWVYAGHAQAMLRKQARLWKKENLAPKLVRDELRMLLARFPMPPRVEAEPEIVGAVLEGEG